jgi:hypothetical protein
MYSSAIDKDQISPENKRALLDEYLEWCDFGGVFVLSPEWSVDVPLWPNSGAIDELVPEALQEKLTAWQNIFDSNYRWSEESRPEGWLSKEAKDQWELTAPDLVAELRSALEGKASLIVDLWPITPSEDNRELQNYRKARKEESDHWQYVLKEAGIKLSLRSPFYDESGNRIEWNPGDGLDEP